MKRVMVEDSCLLERWCRMANPSKHRLVIDKEYIEMMLGKKITQSQANEIIVRMTDNDGLWEIIHESIDVFGEEVCNDKSYI